MAGLLAPMSQSSGVVSTKNDPKGMQLTRPRGDARIESLGADQQSSRLFVI